MARSQSTLLLWICATVLAAQDLPTDRSIAWQDLVSDIEDHNFEMVNVLEHGLDTLGLDNSDRFRDLQEMYPDSVQYYFPSGTYRFEETIVLNSHTSLLGDGRATILQFEQMDSDLIRIRGTVLSDRRYRFHDALQRGDSLLILEAEQDFSQVQSQYLWVNNNDLDKVHNDWAINSTGQILELDSVNGDSLWIAYPLRRDYDTTELILREVRPAENVQIRCLSLQNNSPSSSQRRNIDLRWAVRCKISGVHSERCNFAHVALSFSHGCLVQKSHMVDGHDYGGGGRAYGVVLQMGSGQNHIYDNVLEHLRHSILLQAGANGNVIAYNYSFDPFWEQAGLPDDSAGELVLHGNWPYLNLFESNLIQNIVIDDSHGRNGPHNTFFRNRAEGFGIFMNFNPPSDGQNFVGNEVTSTEFLKGLYFLQGEDHFEWGNSVQGDITPSGTDSLLTASLYLDKQPMEYVHAQLSWPSLGLESESPEKTIPAKLRFDQGVDPCEDFLSSTYQGSRQSYRLFPNPTTGRSQLDGYDGSWSLSGWEGTLIALGAGSDINLSELPPGIYFLRLLNQHGAPSLRIVLQ